MQCEYLIYKNVFFNQCETHHLQKVSPLTSFTLKQFIIKQMLKKNVTFHSPPSNDKNTNGKQCYAPLAQISLKTIRILDLCNYL